MERVCTESPTGSLWLDGAIGIAAGLLLIVVAYLIGIYMVKRR